MTFDLYIDVKKLRGGWWWAYLDYNVSAGPFLSFEIEIGDGPGPEIDNRVFGLHNPNAVPIFQCIFSDCKPDSVVKLLKHLILKT